MDIPGGSSGKESTCQCRRHKRHRFSSWGGKIPRRREWQPTPGESHGQRGLVGYSLWGGTLLDMTEHSYLFLLNIPFLFLPSLLPTLLLSFFISSLFSSFPLLPSCLSCPHPNKPNEAFALSFLFSISRFMAPWCFSQIKFIYIIPSTFKSYFWSELCHNTGCCQLIISTLSSSFSDLR